MSTPASVLSTRPSKALHLGLWVVQALLALAFLMAGGMKLATHPDQLVAMGMNWVSSVPAVVPKAVGALEVFGAVGLILPSATRVQPRLTYMAAGGLLLTMVVAAGVHISLGEAPMIVPNIILGALAAFVTWGRASRAPIAPR